MTKTQAPTPTSAADVGLAVPVDPTAHVSPMLMDILDRVPEAAGDGGIGIIEAIAAARSVDDLDAPWESAGLEAYEGRALVIRGISKRPSDFPDGIGWYLIVDAVDEATGQIVTLATGAAACMAQLLMAHHLGGFPLRAIPRVASKPTSRGYYPQHLELVD